MEKMLGGMPNQAVGADLCLFEFRVVLLGASTSLVRTHHRHLIKGVARGASEALAWLGDAAIVKGKARRIFDVALAGMRGEARAGS